MSPKDLVDSDSPDYSLQTIPVPVSTYLPSYPLCLSSPRCICFFPRFSFPRLTLILCLCRPLSGTTETPRRFLSRRNREVRIKFGGEGGPRERSTGRKGLPGGLGTPRRGEWSLTHRCRRPGGGSRGRSVQNWGRPRD